jgi:hypothetical protein
LLTFHIFAERSQLVAVLKACVAHIWPLPASTYYLDVFKNHQLMHILFSFLNRTEKSHW